MRNNPVKLFWISASDSDVVKNFLSRALVAVLFSGAKPFKQFWKRASWGTFM